MVRTKKHILMGMTIIPHVGFHISVRMILWEIVEIMQQ